MRKLVIALATTAGFGLMASSGATAAPAFGAVIDAAASATTTVSDVGYRRHYGHHHRWHCPPRRCWRWDCRKVYRTFR